MSNEHEALKPCPFCGGEAAIGGGGDYNVMCLSCPTSVVGDTEAEAITTWNTRATPSPSTDTLLEAETYRAMHEIARGLGYPSILEALEAAPPLGWSDCGNVGWCHAEGRCTRHTDRNTGGSHD